MSHLKLFKERFLSLKQGLDEHEAEITIAVRLPSQGGEDEEEITAEEITDFFSDHAFEFVDVPVDTADVPVPVDPHGESDIQEFHICFSTDTLHWF